MTEESTELLAAKKRLSRTKYLALIALCAWPLGLFHSIAFAVFIFAVLMLLWGVSTYIAFMHHWAIKNRKGRVQRVKDQATDISKI